MKNDESSFRTAFIKLSAGLSVQADEYDKKANSLANDFEYKRLRNFTGGPLRDDLQEKVWRIGSEISIYRDFAKMLRAKIKSVETEVLEIKEAKQK